MRTEGEIRAEVERLRDSRLEWPRLQWPGVNASNRAVRAAALEWALSAPVSTAQADEAGDDEIVEAEGVAIAFVNELSRLYGRGEMTIDERRKYGCWKHEVEAGRAALTAARPLIARSVRESALREAAGLARPKITRPCDCDRCHCGNYGDAEMVAMWDAETLIADAILALVETPNDQLKA